MIKHIFFDLDGTLTDPFEGITSSFTYALSKLGINVKDPQELRRVIGPPLMDSFQNFYGLSYEDATRGNTYYREYFAKYGLSQNKVYEGIPELLETLKRNGKKLYVATSKPIEFAIQVLDGFDITKYFDFISANNFADERHTKTQVIQYIFDSCPEIYPDECIMVGDRKYDIEGAKPFKLKSIGVLFGYAEDGELEAAGADFVVPTVKELEKLLLSI